MRPGGSFVLVAYHPTFIMVNGMPTHFDRPDGAKVAIEIYVHLLSHHFQAARQAGLVLTELEEGLIDDAWLVLKPKWKRFLGQPFSYAACFAR